ncbi:RHS repeat-associated core domain-containing protein [Luteibacter yeojuensis]|uniref:RHS repeat-associated protein n=1 Tax=Luteibacter yeojuensis TaxID=345309 RepID=A0A0F3KU03_9GAMM|nr:RHS repeat-associated core domain-containing protein [Luteibacter yeojuensis]KJV34636.1 hypothetical protein VI08_09815 [Luteibacter yeojuensis]
MNTMTDLNKPWFGYVNEVRERASGSYLLGGRMYDSAMRRFCTVDGASPFDAGGLNRYAYCGGDPINRVDPSGESFWEWLGMAVGIGIAVAAAIASGGALAAAAGAAGGLGAALSTSSGVIAASTAALDVMSVGVEIGSVIASIQGDQQTADLLGWVGVSMGLASFGSAAESLVKGAGKAAIAAADDGIDGVLLSGRGAGRARTASVTRIDDPRQLQDTGRLKVVGAGVLGGEGVKTRVYANWRHYQVGAAVHYAPDMKVNLVEVKRMVPRILQANPTASKLIFHGGVHGRWDGMNYLLTGAHRKGPSNMYRQQVASLQRQFGTRYDGRDIAFNNLSGMSGTDVETIFREGAVHVHIKCYGASDKKLRRLAGVAAATSYTGPRHYVLTNGTVVPYLP